jgi:hypothetical protein
MDRERYIKDQWRRLARVVKFDDKLEARSLDEKLTFKLTVGWRDDTNNQWFAIECEDVLVHCGPLL